eukprot:scaffold141181_cov19-Tisochrysis_lutea.AAC.1
MLPAAAAEQAGAAATAAGALPKTPAAGPEGPLLPLKAASLAAEQQKAEATPSKTCAAQQHEGA